MTFLVNTQGNWCNFLFFFEKPQDIAAHNSTSPVPALCVCGLMVKWIISHMAFGSFSVSGTPPWYLGGTKHHSLKSEALCFWPTCSLCRTFSTNPLCSVCLVHCSSVSCVKIFLGIGLEVSWSSVIQWTVGKTWCWLKSLSWEILLSASPVWKDAWFYQLLRQIQHQF